MHAINASTNIHDNDINFNHIIEHALSCTLEESDEDVSTESGLRFGMINEVINMEHVGLQ